MAACLLAAGRLNHAHVSPGSSNRFKPLGSRSRLSHITTPPWDEMYVTVHHRLTGNLAAVHPDVEALNGFITSKNVGSNLI
jgi:hypothetical protein